MQNEQAINSLVFRKSLTDTLPVVLGIIPFGLTCGIMGVTAGLTGLETVMMSVLVFAGASQFTAILMLGAAAGGGLVVFTTLVINLRHILMSASLAPKMSGLPTAFKLVLSFGLTDESYAITTAYEEQSGYSGFYQLGASALLYVVWIASTLAGVFFTNRISDPLAFGLDFAMPASFIVLLVRRLKDPASHLTALVAGVASIAGAMLLPGKWYIIIACLLACLVGGLTDKGG